MPHLPSIGSLQFAEYIEKFKSRRDILKPEDVINYCLNNLPDTVLVRSWGEDSIYYNPERKLIRGIYVLTVKEKDGDNDSASNLNRPGMFRVNTGITKESFQRMFGSIPKRPAAGCVVDMDFDFTQTDQIMPHPVYAWMAWVCVLNPSRNTFDSFIPLINESYTLALNKHKSRKLI